MRKKPKKRIPMPVILLAYFNFGFFVTGLLRAKSGNEVFFYATMIAVITLAGIGLLVVSRMKS